MLRELRNKIKESNGQKVHEIAEEIGVHEKTIYKIETNFSKNMYAKYFKWLRKNGIDLNKLFDEM
ncbi:MAG: hypothetical protein AAF688_12155 [Bacteroidota bacterium]